MVNPFNVSPFSSNSQFLSSGGNLSFTALDSANKSRLWQLSPSATTAIPVFAHSSQSVKRYVLLPHFPDNHGQRNPDALLFRGLRSELDSRPVPPEFCRVRKCDDSTLTYLLTSPANLTAVYPDANPANGSLYFSLATTLSGITTYTLYNLHADGSTSSTGLGQGAGIADQRE